ncbi:MAG: helix-turn-helix transcriptional regulator [Chthoniobacterales bacterium]
MPAKIQKKSRRPNAVRTMVSRPPMERMWRIHQEVQRGGHPNCAGLARQFEVSAKTIMRDLDFMRDRLAMPLAYEPVRHGYYYTAPVQDFPMMKVSQGEVAALLLAQKSLEEFRGTPFERPLASAFRKLSTSLNSEMDVAWHEMEEAVSVRRAGAGLADLQIFDALAQAVMKRHEVTFSYHKLEGAKPESRQVRPYHLGCLENQWYLFAHDETRGAVRTFALPRIRAVERTGGTFRRPKDFSLTKILDGSFAVFEGGSPRLVRLRFRGVTARIVAERIWHDSQKITPHADGIELTMRVGLSPDLVRWVLGWGAEADVLEPAEFRTSLAKAARATAKVYRSS